MHFVWLGNDSETMSGVESNCCTDKVVDDGFGNQVCANCWKEQEIWHCEHCGERQTGEPAHRETYPTHEGTTELWFCGECSG